MLRTFARRGAAITFGSATAGATAATFYAFTEQGVGFRREVVFWSKVFPVVADYYLQTSANSPIVKYQKLTKTGLYEETKTAGQDNNTLNIKNEDGDSGSGNNLNAGITNDDQAEKKYKRKRKELIDSLHEKHAPEILKVMLNLKGLYIKLGQVLSVTALPIPEAYRKLFRTLQSDVPGHQEFEKVIKPALEKGLGRPLEELFESVEPIPCGAASIGQAHRAKLKDGNGMSEKERDVIIKVQYPDATWQVPADIECVGDFMKMCVWAGVVDKDSARMSFDEFSRQFLSELDYDRERRNLQTVYESSLDPAAPYLKNNVKIPKVCKDLCTDKIITMSYLPGSTMEAEAKRQLEMLGINTSGGISQIIKDAAKDASEHPDEAASGELVRRVTRRIDNTHRTPLSWKLTASRFLGNLISFDAILWAVRTTRRLILLSQAAAVASIQRTPKMLIPSKWDEWAVAHRTAAVQAERLGEIESWCTALFDVHGHQVFNLGLFNADPHPGNILVVEDDKGNPSSLGLIDYGQCKALTTDEQLKIAKLILSVANNDPDEAIASAFRDMKIITKNDSTEFLAEFGKLMFGPFQPQHLKHSWHMELHQMDKVLYFPKELSMVYRTSLLLRGLAVSLQHNYSIGEQWKHHAREAIDRIEGLQG